MNTTMTSKLQIGICLLALSLLPLEALRYCTALVLGWKVNSSASLLINSPRNTSSFLLFSSK